MDCLLSQKLKKKKKKKKKSFFLWVSFNKNSCSTLIYGMKDFIIVLNKLKPKLLENVNKY